MAEANSYEEQRRRQVEENRRKLEELRLHHLSAAVREAAATPKPVRQIQTLHAHLHHSSSAPVRLPLSPLVTSLVWVAVAEKEVHPEATGHRRRRPAPAFLS